MATEAGYTSAPTITIAGGGGTGATATCTISGVIFDVVVATPGSKLTVAPSLAFSGGAGSGAAATAVIGLSTLSLIAVAAEDSHNDAVAGTHRALVHMIRGYRDEFEGTFNTTNLSKGSVRYTEVGVGRDPITRRHFIATTGSGIVLDSFPSTWDDGDSYPTVYFHVRQSLLKLA